MSTKNTQDITCPQCGKASPFTVWDGINTKENPEMRQAVRDNSAFRFICPHCGAKTLLNYNFLYHQQEDRFIIFVLADGSGREEKYENLLRQFRGYTARLVTSFNDFKEKLAIRDAGMDDRIVELMKSAVWDRLDQMYSDKHIDEVLFAVNEEGKHGFIFRSQGKMVTAMEFNDDLYRTIRETAMPAIEKFSENVYVIGRKWAAETVQKMG